MKKFYFIWYMAMFVFLQAAGSEQKEQWARTTLQQLSEDEKIGQLFMIAVPCNPENPNNTDRLFTLNLPSDLNQEYAERMIRDYHVGGILYVCEGQMPDQAAATNHFQRLSKHPLFIAADYEPGLVRLYDAVKFPRNLTCGAIRDRSLIKGLGIKLARQAKRLGVNIIFTPVVDVNNNPKNPVINDRSFGEDPKEVATRGAAFARAVQSEGVMACAKHFPGHGDTERDSHETLPFITHGREQLEQTELAPFKRLIDEGVQSIMIGHLMVPAFDHCLPTSLSYNTITVLLKNELGFKGLLFSDALIMKAIVDNYKEGEAELKALQAGTHVLVFPADVGCAFNRIKQALQCGQWSREELDARVYDILLAKQLLGLYEEKNRFVCEERVVESVCTSEDVALKKSLYEQAITLVKNDNAIPLSKNETVALIQVGGAKINPFVQTLQRGGNARLFSIPAKPCAPQLQEIIKAVEPYNTVIIGLFEMNKFADQDFGISTEIRNGICHISREKKVILTLFGSPYSLKFFGDQAAIIQAYEEDVDAQQAAARVILGDLKPQGVLPVSSGAYKAGTSLSL